MSFVTELRVWGRSDKKEEAELRWLIYMVVR